MKYSRPILYLSVIFNGGVVSASEYIEDFIAKIRNDPFMAKVIINNSDVGILGYFDISDPARIVLNSVVTGEIDDSVYSQLKKGVSLTSCSNNKCGVIDSATFSIEQSQLDLFTHELGVMPAELNEDLISASMKNDLSFFESAASLSSRGNVTYRGKRFFYDASYDEFSENAVDINALYHRLNFDASMLDYGLLYNRDIESQTLSSQSGLASSIFGFSYTNSNDLKLPAQTTANDIFVNLAADSTVTVYRDDRIIDTQFFKAGVQRLKVANYPRGSYAITLKIKELSGREYEQEEFVYNYNTFSSKGYGVAMGLDSDSYKLYALGYLNLPMFKFIDTSTSVLSHDDNQSWALSLSSQYEDLQIFSDTVYDGNWSSNIRLGYMYGNTSFSASSRQYWGDNQFNHSSVQGSYRYSVFGSVRANVSHSTLNNTITSGVNINDRFTVLGYEPKVQVGVNYNRSDSVSEDILYFVNVSFSLSGNYGDIGFQTSSRHVDGKVENAYGGYYNNSWDSSYIDSVNISADKFSSGSSQISGSLGVGGEYLNGSLYTSKSFGNSDYFTYGGSFNNSLYFSNGLVASSKNNTTSGIIVNLNSHNSDDYKVYASVNGELNPLESGQNFLPLSEFSDYQISFIHEGGFHLSQDRKNIVTLKDEIYSIDLEVTESFLVIGSIVGDDGKPQQGVLVRNHLSHAYTDDNGTFVLNVSKQHPVLEIEGGKLEQIDVDQIGVNNVVYIGEKTI